MTTPRALWRSLPRPVRVAAGEVAAVGVPLAAVLMSHPTAYAFAEPTAIAACLALPLRLRWPWLGLLACVPALLGGLGWPPTLVALYRVGRTAPTARRAAAWLGVTFLTAFAPVYLADSALTDQIMSLMFSLVTMSGPVALGVLVRLRGELSASLAEVERARRAEFTARLDRARADERARIAREIHDAVGHNTTLIAVQAAALAATTTDPGTKETADHLRGLAKQSLAEMRAALGLAGLDHRDRNGLDDLPDLVDRARAAGIEVTYEAAPAPTSPLIGRAVYRVVQEALTNVVKHAPGATVEVRLTKDGNCLAVSVVNTPATTPPPDIDPGGTGLEGLTERVQTAGGTLTATSLPDGGFALQATLPTMEDPPTKVVPHPPTSGGTGMLTPRQ